MLAFVKKKTHTKKNTTTTATTIILGCAELMMVMSFTTNSEACLSLLDVPRPANIFYYTIIIILPMLSLIPFRSHFLTYTFFFFKWYDTMQLYLSAGAEICFASRHFCFEMKARDTTRQRQKKHHTKKTTQQQTT